jgi:hypothetical protein
LATLRLQRGFGDHFLAACDERPSDGYVAACCGLRRLATSCGGQPSRRNPVVARLHWNANLFILKQIIFGQIWWPINHMLAYYASRLVFRVYGLGFRVKGLWFMVYGLGFRV